MSLELMDRLAHPTGAGRTEADIQSDIQTLLSGSQFKHNGHAPKLEEQVGDGSQRRIDVAIGATVIEVKKSGSSRTRVWSPERVAGRIGVEVSLRMEVLTLPIRKTSTCPSLLSSRPI